MVRSKLVILFSCVLWVQSCAYATDPARIRAADSPTQNYNSLSCGQLVRELNTWQIKHDEAYVKQADRRAQDRKWTTVAWTTGVLLVPLFGLFGLKYHGDDINNVNALRQAKADLRTIKSRLTDKC